MAVVCENILFHVGVIYISLHPVCVCLSAGQDCPSSPSLDPLLKHLPTWHCIFLDSEQYSLQV